MTQATSKRGSALLIVLGMLAFMIVSAVGFSAYMRYSRLPSSYLRRTSASRQLVKAALARAIDEVDQALCNNVYPGLGTETVSADGKKKNYWKSRVFIGTNELVQATEMVPVLTLEGLAYIPPPLVNEARYYSRRSPAAAWQSFNFDAGRYAFCAINVSDYFDVNRLAANRPRSSADNARISLSYLFENTEHTVSKAGASEWDTWMDQFREEDQDTLSFTYDSEVPLVSLADFNLALDQENGAFGFSSPICKYLRSTDGTGFNTYSGVAEEDLINRMTFVTDSWFPPTKQEDDSEGEEGANNGSGNDKIYDLATDGQPFKYDFLNKEDTTILKIAESGQKGKARLLDSMPLLGLVALYDYLDLDRVPVSLAAPTLERVPMVCGLKPNFNSAALAVKEPTEGKVMDALENGNEVDPLVKTEDTRTVYQTVSYYLDGSASGLGGLAGGVEALFAYPFAHNMKNEDASFLIEGRAALFFTSASDPMKLRTYNSAETEALHLNKKDFMEEQSGLQSSGVITIPFTPIDNRKFGKEIVEDLEDAAENITLQTREALAVGPQLAQTPLMTITYKWTQTWNAKAGRYSNETRPAAAEIEKAHCGIPPLKSNGETNPEYENDTSFTAKLREGGEQLTLNVALWVCIKNKDGKAVDLVPAHMKDDQTFNGVNNANFPYANTIAGNAFPVLRFGTGVTLTLSPDGMTAATTPQSFSMNPTAILVDDPRFNHAPESWYAATDVNKSAWLQNNQSSDRNGDAFMETSDQGYLQSIYEFAFLPRFSDLESVGDNGPIMGNYENPDDQRLEFGDQRNAKNTSMMWHSYRPYGTNADDFEGLGFTSAGDGFKINPYTDSTNVMMAAFANTPVNWRLASTNDASEETGIGVGVDAKKFNLNYAWNELKPEASEQDDHYISSEGRYFAWTDLTGIARAFMSEMCPNRQVGEKDDNPQDVQLSKDWGSAWDNLWKNADEDRFGAYSLQDTDLWSVDRKFLYGYWRDCFASRQQLFLIFVRAEPLMMGGGEMARIPPQLGARAVALVWRDPTKTNSSANTPDINGVGYPHRTRVLFYKQLD